MTDSSHFDADVVTEQTGSTGDTAVSVVQTNVTESTAAQANIVTGGIGPEGPPGDPGVVQTVVAGTNVTVNSADPAHPIVSATNAVASVNGEVGAVVLDTADIADTTLKRYTNDTDIARLAATSGTNTGDQNLSGLVPKTTTVNGQALSSNVVLTKSDIGLANVDNTSDLNKPVSSATQTAIDGKQNVDSDLTTIAALDSSTSGMIASDGAGWVKKTYAQLKTALSLTKGDVSLGNVDNTSDAAKPISVAQQAALDTKLESVVAGTNVTIDDTDPLNPIISSSGGGVSLADATALAVSL